MLFHLSLGARAGLAAVGLALGATDAGVPALRPAQDPVFAADAPPADGMWLESVDLANMVTGLRPAMPGRSTYNKALKNRDETYPHGLGTHPFSELHVDLRGSAVRFRSLAAIDDEASEWAPKDRPFGTVTFEVWVDGRKRYDSGVVRFREAPRVVDVDLRGGRRMVLVVRDGGDGNDSDNADWLGAHIVLAPNTPAARRPRSIPRPRHLEPTMPLATGHDLRLGVRGPGVIGGSPGRPFLYRLPVTGAPPLSVAVAGLPPGLTFNAETRVLTGTTPPAGVYPVAVTARDAHGATVTRALTLDIGAQRLARTPPMGWNHWNAWGKIIDDAKIRQAADQLIATRLADHGYQYVNVDDGWEGTRDSGGRLTSNASFPDMAALAAYIHSKGLKAGLYSSPGPTTCGGFVGSFGHEEQDARTFAAWGFDFLKYDWCSYAKVAKDESRETLMAPYRTMRRALEAQSRDLVLALCQYGNGKVWQWGKEVGQMWRTTGDITYTWDSVAAIGFAQAEAAPFGAPGGWNDPDLLVLGRMGWGRTMTPTQLTPNEQITHMTLWALLPAPLMLSADLTQIDPFTRDLLTNDEVLAINQDRLGQPAQQRVKTPGYEVWVRPLEGDAWAVALFNRNERRAPLAVRWSELGLPDGDYTIRNVWTNRDLGRSARGHQAVVAGHGALLLRLSRAPAR